jgi:phage tail sheath protein FI
VFEPNAEDLWSKLRRNVSAFLTTEWAAGGLVGATPDQAFYVRCDATNNPPDVQALGQVIAEIGVAVVRPAEFVIFRLSQWAGPAQ